MTNILLTIIITTNNLLEIKFPPTDPTHLYIMETSTNLADTNNYYNPSNHWDDADALLIPGSSFTNTFYQYPMRPVEFYRLKDLGEF